MFAKLHTKRGVRTGFYVYVILSTILGNYGGLYFNIPVAHAATTVMSDDFGTGSSADDIPNWDESVSGSSTQARAAGSGNDSASPDGGRFALINSGEWICREVDATNYKSLKLSYYWRGDADAGSSSDDGIVEYKAGSGTCNTTGWTQIDNLDLRDDSSWSSKSSNLSNTLDGTTFRLRIRTASNSSDEDFRVDGVKVEGDEYSKITICHATGAGTYNKILVNENATGGHFENNGTPKSGHEDDLKFDGDVACPTPPVCGNGTPEQGEQCDEGQLNGTPNHCNLQCTGTTAPSCGNGTIESGEACDDGNAVNTDSCTNACQNAACGDSYLQSPEQCDDGNVLNEDGCSSSCLIEESVVVVDPICMNGIVESPEVCDDGNDSNTDSCTNACAYPACGDGHMQGDEQCDDGNLQDGDSCSANCTIEYVPACGNGTVDRAEMCDDGNTSNGDGCDSQCQAEPITIVAQKIICDNESDLPNWGETGSPDITSSTAADFLESHPTCHLAPDWNFQWGFADKDGQEGVDKLRGDFIGPATLAGDSTGQCSSPWCGPNTDTGSDYENWKTFGPTDTDGTVSVSIPDLSGAPSLWVREELKTNFIPFTYPPQSADENNVTAEIYCHKDTNHYDNYDNIENPVPGGTYYCVAFNVPKKVTIVANKIVCDEEQYLPNWGETGLPDIDENTAPDFVANSNGHCWLQPDWKFQWGFGEKENQSGVHKLPGDLIGEANGTDTSGMCGPSYCGPNTWTGTGYADWKTFGPTGIDGSTSVSITDLEGANRLWVREVLKEGYIPFTYPPQGPAENNVSAEIYCGTDTYNYDNYDYIDNPELDHTYYCVAINAPIPQEGPTCNPELNLLENPSFEDPSLGSGWQIIQPSNPLLKWLVNWVNPLTIGTVGLEIQTNGVTGLASDGVQFAELDGDHPTRISQVLTTIPGKEYSLSFDYSPRPGTPLADNALVVTANGMQLGAQLDADGTSNGGNVWTNHTLSFVATTTATTVEFTDLGADNSYGVYLDRMSLTCQGDPRETTDVCPNLEGDQTEVPEGYTVNNDGQCVTNEIVDLCPNIAEIQTEIPQGMVIDNEGDCVTPNNGGGGETITTSGGGSRSFGGHILPSIPVPQDNPQVQGFSTEPQDNPSVLGFELLPNTGGDLVNYYLVITSIFGLILSGLYVSYRRRSAE